MDLVIISTFIKTFVEDCYKNFKDFLSNEVQILLFPYGMIMIVSYFIARKYFSLESKNFFFLFGFCVASILFAVGYTFLNGFHWILVIPFLLLAALPHLNNKNGEDGNKNNNTSKKGKSFIFFNLE